MANNFSFDDSEFADDAADDALQVLEQTPTATQDDQESEPDEDELLADVDTRLQTADYYRAILKTSFFEFDGPPPAASQVVDRELRTFVRERLEILLGLRSPKAPVAPPAPPIFNDEEVRALKLLASKVLKKPSLVEAPVVRKVEAPKPPAQPQVKRAQLKKIVAPSAPHITKPRPPEEKPAKAAKAAKQALPTPKPGAETQVVVSGDGQRTQTLIEGDLIQEQGRKYLVVKNDQGTLYKKDVTGQVVPPGVSKPMTAMEIEVASRMQAEKQLEMVDQSTGRAIIHSLMNR